MGHSVYFVNVVARNSLTLGFPFTCCHRHKCIKTAQWRTLDRAYLWFASLHGAPEVMGGFKGGMVSPELGPRQVPGEAVWRPQNATKPFSGRGSARTPAVGAYSTPTDPLADRERVSCPLPIPKNPTPALGSLRSGFGLSSLPSPRK